MMKVANVLDPIATELPPAVWDHPASPEPTLKPIHAHWITTHVYEILERGGYTKPHEWLKLYVTGSLCSYQYSDSSDVDVSLFVDAVSLPEWSRAEMIGLMIKGVEGLTLPGTPYELQAYVVPKSLTPSDLYRPGLRAGYDIATHHWVSPPDRGLAHDVKAQENGSYVYALEVADKMHKLLEYEPSKAVLLWHQIHRKRGADEKMGKGDFAESNLAYKMLFKRGLVPQIAEISGEHIAAWTGPGDVNMTTQPAQTPMQQGPFSPYANVKQWQVNIGWPSNHYDTSDAIRNMMFKNHPQTPFQIQEGKGGWEGVPEKSIALHLYDTPHHQMQDIMNTIGSHMSDEEAFAVIPQGYESGPLWSNPYHPSRRSGSAAPMGSWFGPLGSEVLPEGLGGSDPLLPFSPGAEVASSPFGI